MPRICELCGKGTAHGSDGVHKHGGQWARRAPTVRRRWRPNLRSVRVEVKGAVRKMRLCAKCLKSTKIETTVEEK